VTAAGGSALRRLARAVWRRLPTWVVVLSPLPRERTRETSPNVEDVASIPVQPGVRLDVYWLKPPFGPGPAASLYAGRREIMRFDCLGGDRGHMHLGIGDAQRLAPGAGPRLYFRPGSVADHIERAVLELERNAPYAAATSLHRTVRGLTFDPDRLHSAAVAMRADMLAALVRHGGEAAPSAR
jgi:hypothetical protein